MKSKTLFLVVLFLFIALIFFIKQTPIQKNITKIIHPTIQPSVSPLPQTAYTPYMIQTLRNRKYQKSTITLGKKAYETTLFTAYVATYMSDGLKINTLISYPKGLSLNNLSPYLGLQPFVPHLQTNASEMRPKNNLPKDKKYPVLVMCHGYIEPSQYSTISSYKKTFDYYAAQGFIVLKPDYRGNGTSDGDKADLLYYSRLSYPIDVLHLIASIPTISNADNNQIFLWGHSLGGDVALRVMEVNDKIKAASLWAPVSADYPESLLYYIRRKQPQNLQKYKDALKMITTQDELDALSPSKNLGFIKTPIIIHQGTADIDVPQDWNIELDKRLTKDNINHQFYLYKGEDHNFNDGSRGTILRRDIEFFNVNIK